MAKRVITPAWQTSRGPIVQAHGCAVGVPVAGAKVFGETRQNLWVNPSGTNNGVTVTSNGDGSMTVSGTVADGSAPFFVTPDVYALKPGASYILSIDKDTDFDAYGVFVQYLSGGKWTTVATVAGSSGLTDAFDLPQGAEAMRCGVQITSAGTYSGTYRVMLNEGSEAQPWCPPGLSSVGELSIKAGASEGDPDASTAPIDLSGHELRSLPDGTRDVLTVDGSGAVSVEPWCYDFVLTGEESWIKSESRENSFYIVSPGLPGFAIGSPSDSFVLCDKLPVVGTLAEYEKSTDSVLLYEAASLNVRHTASTLEEFKSWLASNNIHVVVAARAPFDAVPLDPITPPSIPAADATLWAASDVPCELEATTWTASGAEQGRQQAAMVKVAQQVRQQAETVAALAAKALEA